jgi:hypothetical protein
LLRLTACDECRAALSSTNYTDEDSIHNKLIVLRQCGGLLSPSKGMVKVCTVAEMVWRFDHSMILKRKTFAARVLSVLEADLRSLWPPHLHSRDTKEHCVNLVKTSIIIFFNTRRFHDVKRFNCRNFASVKRYTFNKQVHFRSQ